MDIYTLDIIGFLGGEELSCPYSKEEMLINVDSSLCFLEDCFHLQGQHLKKEYPFFSNNKSGKSLRDVMGT